MRARDAGPRSGYAGGMLLLALACTAPDSKDTAPAETGPTDADADGVYTPEDCDDGDAAVFPGAPDDLNGDGVDTDCDGHDGVPFVGCEPILVPDVYPTIEDALTAGETNLCLGAGTFTPAALAEGTRGPSAFRGQGRDHTFVVDPAAHYAVGVLAGLTASGIVSKSGSLSFNDVSIVDATVADFDNLTCDRCAFVRSPIEIEVVERIAGIVMSNSWITGAETAIHVVTDGCATAGACSGYFADVRLNNMTFTDNTTAFEMDLSGSYSVYLVIANSIFLDHETLLAVELTGRTETGLYPNASQTMVWGTTGDAFPDGYAFNARENDPELDLAFSPPRPMEDSPALDSAGDDAALTDFWGATRTAPDKGAVER